MSMLNAALNYAKHGIPIFPCRTDGSKAPYFSPGFHAATTDLGQIRRWWAKWPNALIGMPTGPASGIDVLDLDVKPAKNGMPAKDGLSEVPDWETLSPVIVETPSGGRHLWFRSDGTLKSTSNRVAWGVDTRGIDGYVIVPPSAGYAFFECGLDDI